MKIYLGKNVTRYSTQLVLIAILFCAGGRSAQACVVVGGVNVDPIGTACTALQLAPPAPCSGAADLDSVCTTKYNDCITSGAQPSSCFSAANQYNASMNANSACVAQGGNCPATNLTTAASASQQLDSLTSAAEQAALQNAKPIVSPSGAADVPITINGPSVGASNCVYTSGTLTPTQPDPTTGKCPLGTQGYTNGNLDPSITWSTGNLPPYVPLEPIPGLPQTGNVPFGQLVNQVFKILITLGALVAVGSFVYGGITYMFSEAAPKVIKAKARLWSALWGLTLLIGSWVILFTINPQLVVFNGGLNPSTLYSAQNPTTSSNTDTVLPSPNISTGLLEQQAGISAAQESAIVQTARDNPSDPNAQKAAQGLQITLESICVRTPINGTLHQGNTPCVSASGCSNIPTIGGVETCTYSQ